MKYKELRSVRIYHNAFEGYNNNVTNSLYWLQIPRARTNNVAF